MQHMQRTHATVAGYSADTEILTRAGWKTFPDLSWDDEFASRSPEGKFEWRHATQIVRAKPYQGEMTWLHGRALDVLVTPGCRVPWMPDARSTPRVWHAEEILRRPATPARARAAGCMLATSLYEVPDLGEHVFAGVRHSKMGPAPSSVRMTGDQYAAFMGMYMAEGNATAPSTGHDWLIMISQTPDGKGYAEYRDLLIEVFGREPGKGNYGTTWVKSSRALYDYLHPLGKARDKAIPREVLDLSRRQLGIFWHYYWLGDGSYATAGQQVVATGSRVMAGQLQEILQKLGWCASVREEKCRPNHMVKSAGVIYKLGVRQTHRPAFAMDAIPYAGRVGHVSVPNGFIYVRRSGKPIWGA